MSSRLSKVALAGAFAASAAFGQTMPDQVPVKRPDGTIVHPATAGSAQAAPESASAMRPDGTVVRPNAAGITGKASDPVPVKRPDGTVVHPQPTVQRAPSVSAGDSTSRAEERERMRQQAQQAAEERIDRSQREREAASTSPARQIAPTSGQ